jgi:hypothetical protein
MAAPCSCPAHLMSEMELTADEVVVIGRGRLIAAEPITSFIDAHSLREQADTAPAPRLNDLGTLAGSARIAGIDVAVRDERDGAVLGDAAELAAYRIIQEALTNTVRHSNARHADVSLTADGGELVVEVVDDGNSSAPGDELASSAGLGLTGIPTNHGCADRTRTPTGCSGSTSPRAPTCPFTALRTSNTSPSNSTADHAKRSAGVLQPSVCVIY